MLLSMSNHYQTRAPRRQNGAGWTLTFESRFHFSFRKSYLAQTLDIAELDTSILKKHDGLREAKSALKKARFVNNIHSCLNSTFGHLVFCGHNQ